MCGAVIVVPPPGRGRPGGGRRHGGATFGWTGGGTGGATSGPVPAPRVPRYCAVIRISRSRNSEVKAVAGSNGCSSSK